jgi:hypothetical protein
MMNDDKAALDGLKKRGASGGADSDVVDTRDTTLASY